MGLNKKKDKKTGESIEKFLTIMGTSRKEAFEAMLSVILEKASEQKPENIIAYLEHEFGEPKEQISEEIAEFILIFYEAITYKN